MEAEIYQSDHTVVRYGGTQDQSDHTVIRYGGTKDLFWSINRPAYAQLDTKLINYH